MGRLRTRPGWGVHCGSRALWEALQRRRARARERAGWGERRGAGRGSAATCLSAASVWLTAANPDSAVPGTLRPVAVNLGFTGLRPSGSPIPNTYGQRGRSLIAAVFLRYPVGVLVLLTLACLTAFGIYHLIRRVRSRRAHAEK